MNILEITESLLTIVTTICTVVIALSLILLLFRVLKGPSNADRAVALDAVGVNLMGICALIGVLLVTTKFNDVILLVGILSFIGTLAIAKFLEKGVIIDRDMD